MSRLRLTSFAALLVMAALVGGTIIGSVAAATPTPTRPDPATAAAGAVTPPARPGMAEACAAFRAAFAANLGVPESALAPAAKKAAISTIDAAVAAGSITQATGDRLKARVAAADEDGCALLAGRLARIGASVPRAALGVARDGLTAAAGALGMTPAALRAQLRDGETLKTVADASGVPYATVSAAVLAAVKADLYSAVAAGRITQARADRILARLERALADGRLRDVGRAAPAGVAPAPGG